jgi:flagellar biosynthesis protein FliP
MRQSEFDCGQVGEWQCTRGGSSWLRVAVPVFVLMMLGILCTCVEASELSLPGIRFNLDDPSAPKQISGILNTVLFLTVISLAPAILILTTSFTRLAVVLAFLKQALGTQGSPPSQVIVGLAMFLTFFVMQPVWERIHQDAIGPYQRHEISGEEFLDRSMKPLKEFMLKQTRKQDLALFASLSQHEKPKNAESLPITTVVPAFVISELKTAFQIGFLLYLPFIILDMVVSSILLSMGMMMLPPVMISMPFKLMLFVLVDGWNLLVTSLVKSFQ